jgi:TPR repeat protein
VKKSVEISNIYFKKSLSILEQDAERNDPEALCDLAFMYNVGDGVKIDKFKTINYYLLAAEMGYNRALYNLGLMYSNGLGVPKDKERAVYYYQMAADKGHVWAQNNLGLLYEQGEGVGKDMSRAVYWYRIAAEQNHPSAQNNLGLTYEKGEGIQQDVQLAIKYYQYSMENGNINARYNLARFYELGVNGKQNLQLAIEYYLDAAMKGQKQALIYCQDIVQGNAPYNKTTEERESFMLLAVYRLAQYWPESHPFLSEFCKITIMELYFSLRISYSLLPELIEQIIKHLIFYWPERRYNFIQEKI